MSTAASTMEAPKATKRRKLTDRDLPQHLVDAFPDSRMYLDLLEMERKLDWTMNRKKMEIHDTYSKVPSVPRTLRVFLSHSAERPDADAGADPSAFDFATGRGIPSWTFKVEGRLLDPSNNNKTLPHVTQRKFTSFLKGLVIEFDRDPTIYPDGNIIEWRNPSTLPTPPPAVTADQDGFEVKRRGDVSVNARVILHLKRTPERYKLVDSLANVLDIREETRAATITALWHYIKVNGLQDKVDRKTIRPDAKLKQIFGVDQIAFHQLPEIVNRCLKPAEPVVLPYIIGVDPENSTGMQAYDIEVAVEDLELKSRMAAVQTSSDTNRHILALDDEIAQIAQSLRTSKLKLDFLNALSENPGEFVQRWLASQSRDLDVILGNEQGVREEDLKKSALFTMPWVDEAVSIQEGLRVTNALRAQQGTLG